MCEMPTIKEELDRKTVEALAEMTLNHEKGMMTTDAYYQSLHAINLVTNGLIDDEVSLVISDNLNENIPNEVERKVFISGGVVIVMQREMTGDSFDMIKIVEGKQSKTTKSFADADNPSKACFLAFEKILFQLIAKRFKEVGRDQ